MGAQVEKMHADTIITKINKYIFFITNYYLSSCPDALVEGVINKLLNYFSVAITPLDILKKFETES